ncbi:MAG: hypothetical protein Q4C42_06455 [Clostridia bacterium]|nr:hypothetical protein [Clostridia bacterium]
MKESIFRKESLEKVKSPDDLSSCIQVANPGIWVLLLAIIFLLLGLLCWGVFGSVSSTVTAEAECYSGEISCFIPMENGKTVEPGMQVVVDGVEGEITEIRAHKDGKILYIETESPIPDGIHNAEIEVESIHPISFLFN